MRGNEALPGQSPGKLTSLPLANSANTTHRAKRRQARADVAALPGLRPGKPAPQRAAFGNAKCLGTKRKRHLTVPFFLLVEMIGIEPTTS